MTAHRKKPVVIEASQWFKNGDHPLDYSRTHDGFENGELRKFSPEERSIARWEGDIVRYFRDPGVDGGQACKHCGKTMHIHGWIETLEGGHVVCPGDWIITGVKGEHYPCKPDIFALTYEPAIAADREARPAPASVEALTALIERAKRHVARDYCFGEADRRATELERDRIVSALAASSTPVAEAMIADRIERGFDVRHKCPDCGKVSRRDDIHTCSPQVASEARATGDAAAPAGLRWAVEHANHPGEVCLRFDTRGSATAYVNALQAGMDAEEARK